MASLTYSNDTLQIQAATTNATQWLDSSSNVKLAIDPAGVILGNVSSAGSNNPVFLEKFTVDSGPNFNVLVSSNTNATYNGVTVANNAVLSMGWNITGNIGAENTSYYYQRMIAAERGWVWTNGGGPGVDLLQCETHFATVGASAPGLPNTSGDRIRGLSIYTRLDGSYITTVNLQGSTFNFVDDSAAQGRSMWTMDRTAANDLLAQWFDTSTTPVPGCSITIDAAKALDVLSIGRTATSQSALEVKGKLAELELIGNPNTWTLSTGGGTDPALYCVGAHGNLQEWVAGTGTVDTARVGFAARLLVGAVGFASAAMLDVYQGSASDPFAYFRTSGGSILGSIDASANLAMAGNVQAGTGKALQVGTNSVTFGTAAPTTGTWTTGDVRWNSAVASGSPEGWRCTSGGTPGTWSAMANHP